MIIRRAFLIITFLTVCSFSTHTVSARDLYISPTGNSNNPGTQDQPLDSIERARDVIRELGIAGKESIDVKITEGLYSPTQTIVFESQDSGSVQYPITYEGTSKDKTILSGGYTITNWIANGELWQATLTGNTIPRQLFVNNERATRARRTVTNWTKTAAGYQTSSENRLQVARPQDVEVVSQQDWIEYRCSIQSIDNTEIVMQQPCWDQVQTQHQSKPMNAPTWIENAQEFLDEPGEFYFDPQTRIISYLPRSGQSISDTKAVVPALEGIIAIQGVSGSKVTNLIFKNFSLQHATSKMSASTQTSYGTHNIMGTITSRYGDNLTFDSLDFNHSGGAGISLFASWKNITVTNSSFRDLSASGIVVNQSGGGKSIKISNNLVERIGQEYHDAPGILLINSQEADIKNNTVKQTPYSGIALICWSSVYNDLCPNILIRSNLIDQPMQVLYDGGGIYSNYAMQNLLIERNVITNDPHVYGAIYLDDGSMYKTVRENVVFGNLCTLLVKGGSNTITNNYWQDRTNTSCPKSDIDVFVGPLGCQINNQKLDCGSNTIDNNTTITELSGAPSWIITQAGAQAQLKPGDFNQDGSVNLADYNLLIVGFGITYTLQDYNALVQNFNK